MRTEIPVCTRCCFCLPMRYGLVVWGYFNLFVGCLLLVGSIIVLTRMWHLPEDEKYKVTTNAISVTCIVLVMGIAEIILSILFIVGCHKKNMKLLKTFYYYNISLMGLTTILCLYCTISALITSVEGIGKRSATHLIYFPLVELGLLVSNFVFQVYILLVLRTEIMKLNNDCHFRFSNIGGEAECTLLNENINKENKVQGNVIHKEKRNTDEIKV